MYALISRNDVAVSRADQGGILIEVGFNRCKRNRQRSDSVLWQKPQHPQKVRKYRDNIQNATQNFDYTTIADRLRTVSWSDSSQPHWCG